MKYARTITELEQHAVKWWPKELEETVAAASVIPALLASQEQFICILKLSGAKPEQVFDVLAASGMSANLFLKHLAVLADYGGELIKRIGREFSTTFKADAHSKKPVMHYVFKGEQHVYTFLALPVKGIFLHTSFPCASLTMTNIRNPLIHMEPTSACQHRHAACNPLIYKRTKRCV